MYTYTHTHTHARARAHTHNLIRKKEEKHKTYETYKKHFISYSHLKQQQIND